MKYYVSNINNSMAELDLPWKKQPAGEMKQVRLYDSIKYQEIIGIGGAATEAAAYTYAQLDAEGKKKLLDLYFGTDGIGYNFLRLHIQSCDFALGNYAYVDDLGENILESFQIDRDQKYIIPFVKAALSLNPELEFLASPWSPPSFMKTNGEMNHGGKLKTEYYDTWAEVICLYLKAYKNEGIVIRRLTVQNEPAATQVWDSCVYSAREEAVFAVEALKPALLKHGLDYIKVNIWDHNKEIIIDRAKESFDVKGAEDVIDGIAFHWYTGDHFEALSEVRTLYPEKELIFTEGCVEYSRFASDNQVQHAIMYAHDMIGDFKAGANGFLDWNILLDEQGGPNHVGNFCDAPVMGDTKTGTLDVKLSYYFIGHISKFVKRGARRILVSSYKKDLECLGFINPDGSRIVIVLNNSVDKNDFCLSDGEYSASLVLMPNTIATFVIDTLGE